MLKGKGALLKQKMIGKAAEHMVMNVEIPPAVAEVTKSLAQSRVALITTAGVHVKDQSPFDVKNGDHTFREIPDDTPISKLMISHTHYDRSDADRDINCVFPLEHLQALSEQGIIASTARLHYGWMGYIPKPGPLMEETAPEVAKALKQDGVDIAIFSPG